MFKREHWGTILMKEHLITHRKHNIVGKIFLYLPGAALPMF